LSGLHPPPEVTGLIQAYEAARTEEILK